MQLVNFYGQHMHVSVCPLYGVHRLAGDDVDYGVITLLSWDNTTTGFLSQNAQNATADHFSPHTVSSIEQINVIACPFLFGNHGACSYERQPKRFYLTH